MTDSLIRPPAAQAPQAAQAPVPPVLDEPEAAGRLLILAGLQAALAESGIRCVLARNHRLVLRYNDSGSLEPSGLTDPALHILGPDGTITVTTDGATYRIGGGMRFPADDPAAAAAHIRGREPAVSPG
jgi:hypothetical protein